MFSRFGQFAMEYLLVVGFSVVLLIPVLTLLHGEYVDVEKDLEMHTLDEAMEKLVFESERIYQGGESSRNTIDITLPDGLRDIQFDGRTITADLGETSKEYYSDVPFTSESNISNPSQNTEVQIDAKRKGGMLKVAIHQVN